MKKIKTDTLLDILLITLMVMGAIGAGLIACQEIAEWQPDPYMTPEEYSKNRLDYLESKDHQQPMEFWNIED